jgi:transcriptional regulator with XRE-family HTH domain
VRNIKRKKLEHPLGRFLHERRRSLGWSMEKLAQRSGTELRTVSDAEAGYRTTKARTYLKLAAALECEIPPELLPATDPRRPRSDACPIPHLRFNT